MSRFIDEMSIEEIEEFLKKKRAGRASLEVEFKALQQKIHSVHDLLTETVEACDEFYSRNVYVNQDFFDDLKNELRELENVVASADVTAWSYSSRNC
jgi:DNA-binding transcriptional MerR regulator